MIWALDALRRRGLAETRIDLAAAALRTLEAWRELPDYGRVGRLYGETFRSLNPPHGLVGNVHVLRGALENGREPLERETGRILARLAVREDGS